MPDRQAAGGTAAPFGVVDNFLKACAALVKRTSSEIVAADVEDVEGDERRRRAEDAALVVAEQVEAADELLVIHGHLAIQHQRLRR